jgi:hypothetical protein
VSPVRYELGSYIPEDDILHVRFEAFTAMKHEVAFTSMEHVLATWCPVSGQTAPEIEQGVRWFPITVHVEWNRVH